MAFGGTLVTAGTAQGVVVATGARSELGQISRLLSETVELQTPLTRRIAKLAKAITVATVAVAGLIFVVGVLRAYAHRHGPGPLPSADPAMSLPEVHNVWNRWQGDFRVAGGFLVSVMPSLSFSPAAKKLDDPIKKIMRVELMVGVGYAL